MSIVSYAQNFEDVMLWRAFSGLERGFYIDIGAQDPVVDSVSLSFHVRGWRGIHVEPVAKYAELLRQQRPGDVVLQAAVGSSTSISTFFEIAETGLSTVDEQLAADHAKRGMATHQTRVPCVPLASVFELVDSSSEIHWLKIDVEGSEHSVLHSWGSAPRRPWIVLVESTAPLTQIESFQSWEPLLLSLGYEFVYFDGLNRFYVSEMHRELTASFSVPPNVFDGFQLNGTANATFHRLIESRFREKVASLHAQIAETAESTASELSAALERQQILAQEAAQYREVSTRREQELILDLAKQESRYRDDLRASETKHADRLSNERLQTERYQTEASELGALLRQSQGAAIIREREFADKMFTVQHEHAAKLGEQLGRLAESEKRQSILLSQINQERTRLDDVSFALAKTRQDLADIQHSWLWRLLFRRASGQDSTELNAAAKVTAPSSPNQRSGSLAITRETYMPVETEAHRPATSVKELLDLEDAEFVSCAYMSVLGRRVDPEGLSTYLAHIRAGADKAEMLLAIAKSPEARDSKTNKFIHVDQLEESVRKNRPSFWTRRITTLIQKSFRPLIRRMDVSEYRINKIEQVLGSRLDRLESVINDLRPGQQTSGYRGSHASEQMSDPENPESKAALRQMSFHARSIYFELKDAADHHLRTSVK